MIKAVLGTTVIVGGWLTVQMAWQRVFGETTEGKGPMGRCGCSGCYRSTCDATDGESGEAISDPQFKHEG